MPKKWSKNLTKFYPSFIGAEFCLIVRSFFGQWSFKKKCFWDLLTFTRSGILSYDQKENREVIWCQVLTLKHQKYFRDSFYFLFIMSSFHEKKTTISLFFSLYLDFRLVRAGASHYVFWWGKSRDTLLLASSIHGMKWNLGGHPLKLIRVSGSILYIPLIMFYFSSRVLILSFYYKNCWKTI